MDTNPQYRQKTDPKVDPNLQYNTEIRSGSSSTTGWIIGGLIVLALIAAYFLWGGSGTPPQSPTGTTTEQPVTPPQPPATPTPSQPQGISQKPASPQHSTHAHMVDT